MRSPAEDLVPALDEPNRLLLARAHPPDWGNPEPARRYDLVVVGAGPAGLATAAGAAGLGAKVALVERRLMGGDCLNFGCVPSKALIRSARAAADVRRAGAFGVRVPEGAQVDFAAVMERVRRVRARIAANESAECFRSLGVDVFLGSARFVAPRALQAAGRTLRFRKAVIATGARPAAPDVPGLAEAGYLTNETVFDLTERPRRLAVIGGGPVGCELAQAFARLGCEVTLVHRHAHLLDREDPEAAEVLHEVFRREGIRLELDSRVQQASREGGETLLRLSGPQGETSLRADAVLAAAGRRPNIEGLGLEAAGVEFGGRGVVVDDYLQTSNAAVYAVGDVCLDGKFTHAPDAAARLVLRNALFLGSRRVGELTMPWCTYTDPEVAHVGLYERQAREQGLETESFRRDLREVDRAVADGEEEGFCKVVVEKGTDRILGATLVSRHGGETLGELTAAMAGGLGLKALAEVIHPYPTQAEALRQAADAYNRTRLTPAVRQLLRFVLSLPL